MLVMVVMVIDFLSGQIDGVSRVSEGVKLQLLLYVGLCHLLVRLQQLEDGRQLLLLHPGMSTHTHTHTVNSLASRIVFIVDPRSGVFR